MIISTRISGGLGNQLFQYCAGLALSNRWGGDLRLDKSWYRFSNYKPERPYRLNQFCLPHASQEDALVKDLVLLFLDQLARRAPALGALSNTFGVRVVFEKNVHTKPDYLYGHAPECRFLSLSGYWQTVDHFLNIRSTMLRSMRPEFELSPEAEIFLRRTQSGPSAFLHVRRGDFVSLGHPLLSLSYYRNSVSFIEKHVSMGLKWFIFSDDHDWCRKELRFLNNPVTVNLKGPMADLEEFQIMRACHHGVVANSSFSWWAAALMANQNAVICAPKNRYGNKGGASIQRERVLPNWVLIE